MPARDNPLSSAGLVADPPAQNGSVVRKRTPVTERTWLAPGIPDAMEDRRRRRARLQGFALMAASSVISIMMLYGAWRLLHALV